MNISIILLTRFFNNSTDFHDWCNHHFSLGINHIHIFDDCTKFNLEKECEKYGNKISYEKVSEPQQYQLYNKYIKECDSDYIMPIDDDEYLWISPDLGSIQSAIEYYTNKFGTIDVMGIRWLYKFPKEFHTERTCSVLEYCTEENDYLATRFSGYGNNIIKCLLRKETFIRYIDADESITSNHVPLSTNINGAILCDGNITTKQFVSDKINDEKLRLIHCPYKGYSEYKAKQENHLTVSHKKQKQRHYDSFNVILDKLK